MKHHLTDKPERKKYGTPKRDLSSLNRDFGGLKRDLSGLKRVFGEAEENHLQKPFPMIS